MSTAFNLARRALLAVATLMLVALVTAALTLIAPPAHAQEKFIVVASTTSTEQSGLFTHLLPAFESKTGIKVRIVAVGTGQALDQGRRGDADVVFVHDKPAEEKFVADGFSTERKEVMVNDFIIIGPKVDPAKAQGQDVLDGLKKIENAGREGKAAAFVSRGDKSGTHAAEVRYWKAAGIDIDKQKGAWYRECGCGMGPALNTAASMNAYVLTDRGTWLSFKNRQDLGVVVEGDSRLFNQYGVMLVNPAKHPHVKKEWGQTFIDWLVSPAGQQVIANYKIGGEQLFFPNAKKS